jgi:hypothetical protein
MKILISILFFLIPFHALIITFLQWKLLLDVNFLRFWKEIIVLFLLFLSIISELKRNNFSIKKIYKNNNLLWTITFFTISSLIYIYFPFFELKTSWFLWFKYDVFFFFALLIWLYLPQFRENFNFYLKTIFISVVINLVIFLPVYLSWNVASFYTMLWYNNKVSTYNAWQTITYSQNTPWDWWTKWTNRFQWSFSWPITFSVFITIFIIICIWFILENIKENKKRTFLISILAIFIILSIYISYSKTSILWIFFWTVLFTYLGRKIIYNKKISKNFLINWWLISIIPISLILYLKRDLFLHLDAIINRFDNLVKSAQMFIYNPFWYGLWIAWPASQIWKSIESAWTWQIWTSNATTTHRFLPENWYVQILLEQWLLWALLFISILLIIWFILYNIMKNKKDYLSISIFVAFVTLCFMANFTHAFEESATSYILFMIIGWYIALNKQKYVNN